METLRRALAASRFRCLLGQLATIDFQHQEFQKLRYATISRCQIGNFGKAFHRTLPTNQIKCLRDLELSTTQMHGVFLPT